MVHSDVSQLKQSPHPPKKLWNPYFSAGIRCLLLSNKTSTWTRKRTKKTTKWVHWCFLCKKWFCLQSQLVMFKKPQFSAGFRGVCSWFVSPFFSWLYFFLFVLLFGFIIYFFFLIHQSSFYVLVLVSYFFFGFMMSFSLFFVWGGGLFCEGLRVKRGGRMANSLGPKPSLFVLFFWGCIFMRVQALGPKPSLFVLVCFGGLFYLLEGKNLFSPERRAFLLILVCLTSRFHCLFLCLCLSLSLSLLSCFIIVFFLSFFFSFFLSFFLYLFGLSYVLYFLLSCFLYFFVSFFASLSFLCFLAVFLFVSCFLCIFDLSFLLLEQGYHNIDKYKKMNQEKNQEHPTKKQKTCYVIKIKPPSSKARNYTTDAPAWLSIIFWVFQKKGQIIPNIGKHGAKQELETVPPQELGAVPISNSPVLQFLTLDLLVAAEKINSIKKVVQFLALEKAKKWYRD